MNHFFQKCPAKLTNESFINLHAEAVDNHFQNQHGTSTTQNVQRLTSKESKQNANDSCGQDTFHRALQNNGGL